MAYRRPPFNGGSFIVNLERYIEADDKYVDITVRGHYSPGYPPRTSGPSHSWDPGDPGELEITSSYYLDENDNKIVVELTDAEEEQINEMAPEDAEDRWESEYDDYLESRAEARLDLDY